MATFVTVHKRLNFCDMQFVNGRFETDDPKQIKMLSSVEARRCNVVRLDPPAPKPKAVKEEAIEASGNDESEKPKRSSNGRFAKKQ